VSDLYDDGTLAALQANIDGWLAAFAASMPAVRAVDRADGDERRWYVRMAGEDKDVTTVWITLGQRTLRYETYVMPAPEENAAELYEHLLRRNERLVGAHFSIGVEDAVFLRGELPVSAVTADELDRAIGTLYAVVEQVFRGLLRIGFASRFERKGDPSARASGAGRPAGTEESPLVDRPSRIDQQAGAPPGGSAPAPPPDHA
jgi:hypothetical protein